MDGIEKRLRDFADNPAANGMVPVQPATLREAADEIEALREANITLSKSWPRARLLWKSIQLISAEMSRDGWRERARKSEAEGKR
jgi:hypothetical protein